MTEEERIAALFAAPERAPDEAFVARVGRALLAEQRMAAARRALWRRFGIEAVASAAVIAAFYWLWRLSPALTLDQMPIAPSAAAILVLFLWFAAELRPFALER